MLADAHCPTVARKRLRVEKPEKSMYSTSRLVQFISWGGGGSFFATRGLSNKVGGVGWGD